MSTLQELLRERQRVSNEWNDARAAEVEQERARLDPQERQAEAERRAAELDTQIRETLLQQRIAENQASYIPANRAAVADLERAIDVILNALSAGEAYARRVGQTFDDQQAFVDGAVGEYTRDLPSVTPDEREAYNVELNYRNTVRGSESRFQNALPLWAALMKKIATAKTPQERQFLKAIGYAYRGELYEPSADFEAQTATDSEVRRWRAARWRR